MDENIKIKMKHRIMRNEIATGKWHVILTSLADIRATSVQALDNMVHKPTIMAAYTKVRIGSTKT